MNNQNKISISKNKIKYSPRIVINLCKYFSNNFQFNKIENIKASVNWYILILTLLSYIIFHPSIEKFIEEKIITTIFLEISNEIYYDISIIAFVLLCIIVIRKNEMIFSKLLGVIFFTTIVYSIYRFNLIPWNSPWHYISFKLCNEIYYLDIVYILLIIALTQIIVQQKTKSKKTRKSQLYNDESIGPTGIDEFGYETYATNIANKINNSTFQNAFAIGINGKWGSGKTSFFDLIKKQLTGSDIIKIDFAPWNSNSSDAIIQDFFETLNENLKPILPNIAHQLQSYSNKLTSLKGNSITNSIQLALGSITGFESINQKFKAINKALTKHNQKLIIFIDDVDRLDQKEIIEVLRLIRNTANFYNTFFIVAYDRNYLVEVIGKYNAHQKEYYLEKIFQLEVSLPYVKYENIKQALIKNLKESLANCFHSDIEEEINKKQKYELYHWVENIRDVTRFSNQLLLNINEKLENNISFSDFFKLELIRMKSTGVYEIISKYTNEYLELKHLTAEKSQYILKISKENKEKTVLEEYLSISDKFSNDKKRLQYTIHLLKVIFSDLSLNRGIYSKSNLSVIFPSKFNRYFAYTLLEGSLSEIDFSNALKSDLFTFKNKINEWINQGLSWEIFEKFTQIKDYDNKEDFEKTIEAMLYYSNTEMNYINSILHTFTIRENLFKKIVDWNRIKTYYKKDNNEESIKENIEEYQAFILNLFKRADSPYLFESSFLNFFQGYSMDEIDVLSKDNAREIIIEYLQNYCSKQTKLDSNIWKLYHNCMITEWENISHNSWKKYEIMPEAPKIILRNFILNTNAEKNLAQLISKDMYQEGAYKLESLIKDEIWSSWDDFKSDVDKLSPIQSDILLEFKLFCDKLEANGFKSITFEFSKIQFS